SSHSSPGPRIASPQLAGTGMHAPPVPSDCFGQLNPGSTNVQSAAHPLPSSHASPGSAIELPQTQMFTHACPTVGQSYPGSMRHRPEHPSPGTALPSSQFSEFCVCTIESPQYSSTTQGLPGVGHV